MSFEKLSRPRVWYKYYSIYQEVSKVTNVGFSGLLYRNFWGVVTFGGLLLSGVVTFGGLLLSGGRNFRGVVTFVGLQLSGGCYFRGVVTVLIYI